MAIIILSPVEDYNKPLDNLERIVYKKRTIIVLGIEKSIYILTIIFNLKEQRNFMAWFFIMFNVILIAGTIKNIIIYKSKSEPPMK